MTSFIAHCASKFASFIPNRMSFRGACVASGALHVLLLLVFAMVLPLLDVPNLFEPPLVLDFVFAASDSYHNSHNSDNESESNNGARGSQTGRSYAKTMQQAERQLPDSQSEPSGKGPAKEIAEDRLEKNKEQTAEDLSGVVSSESNRSMDRTYLVSAIEPTSFTRPETRLDLAVPATVKIPISKKERKMFRKKIRKWTQDFHKLDLQDSKLVWRHKGQEYSATFQRFLARSNTDIEQVVVKIETEENGIAFATEMRMKRLAFSSFAQFVDFWDPWVAVHDDVLEGRFHTNSRINILDSRGVKPKFYGKVTTASFDINTTSRRPFFDDKEIFVGGLETGVKVIKLPKRFRPFLEDSTITAEQVHRFDTKTRIAFHADGSYSWQTIGSEEPPQRQPLSKKGAYYIIGPRKKKLHIKGIVNGKVLVYSPGKIIIDDDLTYASHPEASNLADDYLGIVSDTDVEIAHPSVTGPGDLNIYASIYAKRRFVVRHLKGRGDDTLLIYGSLSAGSISATEPRYGTRIRFDKRLEMSRPPGFPMTDRYEVSEWDGKWEVQRN
ncbi:MAG: hypothetical protein O7G31_12130 [Calditrichaeota bacterium]|nr:hypothetical protein [Calditrichota bacterium]